jgi:inhibitor of cysteine peptidase
MAGFMPARAEAATLLVTNTSDPGVGGCTAAGDGDGCTLREAIVDANNQTLTPGDDTIDASTVSGTISLVTELPSLTTNIVLNGPGAGSLTVRRSAVGGTPEFRVFSIDNGTTSGPTVVISGLTISGGKVSGTTAPANSGGGIYNNHGTLTVSGSVLKSNSATNGGALCNDGSLSVNATLALSDSVISGNIATGDGGGLFNNGSSGGSGLLTINTCTFTGNSATNGGAILKDGHSGGSATLTELNASVLSGNTATGDGGAIENYGIGGGSATLNISYSTLSSNTAINGGAINNDGKTGSATHVISYSTLNANTASGNGGAINNDGRTAGSATLATSISTFHGNSASLKGGAINNDGTGGSATVEIDSSTLKSNSASNNSAAIDSNGAAGSATLAMGSTILDNGPGANVTLTVNSETTFTSKNYNLSSDAAGGDNTSAPGGPYFSAGGDIRNTDPQLSPVGLANNGGLTQTIALLEGSPAIDKGKNIGTATDQRGKPRPNDDLTIANATDGTDIGAFEFYAALRYSISGHVTISSGSPLANVTVTRTGAGGTSVVTDSNGDYTFTGVLAGSYTLTPSRNGYGFGPSSRNVTVGSANVTGQNFVGYTTTLSGRIAFSNGTGIANVQVRLNNGVNVLSNGAGYYTFVGVAPGSYTLTPVLSGYSFDPAYRQVTVATTNLAGYNFVGGYTITGRLATTTGVGIVGQNVSLTGRSAPVVSNSAGYYAFYGVGPGAYTMTPSPVGYSFAPETRSVTVTGTSLGNQNFIGTTGYVVVGRISNSAGTGISGVSVRRTGSALAVTTNSAGYYTFNGVANGTYTITPTMSGMTFTPATSTVTVSGGNPGAQNFIGAG